MGFVIPVSVVSNQKLEENIHLIGEDLFAMFLTVAILTSVLLLIIIFGKSIFCFCVIYSTDRNFLVEFDIKATKFLDLLLCGHSIASSDYSGQNH